MTISLDSKDLELYEDSTTYYRTYCNSHLQKWQKVLNETLSQKDRTEANEAKKFWTHEKSRCDKGLSNLRRFRGYEAQYFPEGIVIPINSTIPRDL